MRRFAVILACITLASLFYVYEEVEAVRVGYQIRLLEERKTQFLDRARALQYNIARLKAPHNLEKKLQAQRIVLESPKTWQTIVLPEPGRKVSPAWQAWMGRPPFLSKLFVGTAQAEAGEASNR